MTDDTESKPEFHYADHGVAGGWPHPASACDPTPEPTDPQPVPDAYRCGDLNDDEWEAKGSDGEWRRPSVYPSWAIRPARRKAPPLTPREGDLVEAHGYEGQVVHVAHGLAVVDTGETLFDCSLSVCTVTDRPPARPVRVWLTDEQIEGLTSGLRAPTVFPLHSALIDACRALVDGEG